MKIALLLILLSASVSAQEHFAKILETLPDGSYVVEIQGVPHRAITGDRAVEIAKQKLELAVCRENEKRFTDLIEIANRDVTIATQRAEIERGNFVRAMALFEKERELRQEAMTFLPRRQVGGVGGKIFNFLESPWGAIFIKGVMQIPPFIKAVRQ